MMRLELMLSAAALVALLASPARSNGPGDTPPEPKPERPAVSITDRDSDNDAVPAEPWAMCCRERPGLVYCAGDALPATHPVEATCPWYVHTADDPWALWRRGGTQGVQDAD